MNTLILEHECLAVKIDFSQDSFTAHLNDGRRVIIPLTWYPRLLNATKTELARHEFIGQGQGIHWPALDEDISVEAMLSGRRSQETQTTLKKWLQKRKKR